MLTSNNDRLRELKRDMEKLLKECMKLKTKRTGDTVEVQVWWKIDNEEHLITYSEVRV